ncbi:ABC transporter permease [Chakrabartyella piscis]|uniref:ABC transporter permease n=1 Tax=Chakrabartyella piscis TaxID=2918914 RepID=UPI0029588F35|nr:ABC transporter permease [Chakrabartyella piscis]
MKKQSSFHMVKREGVKWQQIAMSYLIAIVVAIALGGVLLSVQNVNPFDYYKDMFSLGVVGNKFAYKQVEAFIKLFTPLLLTSVALSLAFKMRFWNIGGEGQFIIGALGAGSVAYLLGETMPTAVVLLLMALVGAVLGGLYGAVVAILKVKHGTNETLLTLMMNYLALYLLKFFGETSGDWNFFLAKDSNRPLFATFPDNAKMITLPTPFGSFSLNLSLVIVVLLCVGVWWYLKYTKQGYEISVVGDSPNSAKYAGMKVSKIVIRTIFLSAALIGLAGAFYASSAGTLSTSMTNDVGWTGIIVAWLAKLNTIGIIVTSLLITVLQHGCSVASSSYATVDANFADLLQGMILFSVLTADFFTRFKLVRNSKQEVAK